MSATDDDVEIALTRANANARLARLPYHTERLWALVRAAVDPKTQEPMTEMCYYLAPSRKELWEGVLELEIMGTGQTKLSLQRAGWAAREVLIEEQGS